MMAVLAKRMSAEDFLLVKEEGYRFELIRGEVIKMSAAGHQHGRIVMNIAIPLGAFVKQHKIGAIYAAETGFVIAKDPDTVRAPDIAFVKRERLERVTEKGFFPGAPDISVEVISPGDSYIEVEEKVAMWLDAGTELVLVVNPRNKTVNVHRKNQDIQTFKQEDKLEPLELLGWQLAVADIFD